MRIISKVNGQPIPNNAGVSAFEISELKTNHCAIHSQAILQRLHKRFWFECACTGYCDKAPTLTIRANPNKTYSLVNISGRNAHKATCNLRYEKFTAIAGVNVVETLNISEPMNIRSLKLLAIFLLEKSSFEELNENAIYSSNKESLMNLGTKNVTINGHPLTSLITFGFRSFHAVRKTPNSLGNFMVEVVDDFEDDKGIVSLKNNSAQTFNFSFYRSITNVYIEHDTATRDKGAYLVLSYIGKNPRTKNKKTIAPLCTVIIPVVSRSHWNTYYHPHYRDVFNGLLNAKYWYKKNKDLDIFITTPTRPITTKLGVCLPDFIVKLGNHTQIISLQQNKPDSMLIDLLKSKEILGELGAVYEICFDGIQNISDHIFIMNKKMIQDLNHRQPVVTVDRKK